MMKSTEVILIQKYSELVDLLIATAKADNSSPPCWRMNELLGAIERLVGVELGQYGDFAYIAGNALFNVFQECEPEVDILLRLAVLNGYRRSDDIEAMELQGIFDEVGEDISNLEEGPRKQRCLSFFLYQQQVFGARQGFYKEASEAAFASANMCEDKAEKAISLYLARVYNMWATIVSDVSYDEVVKAFEELKAELPRLQQAVAGTAYELQWGKGNGPIHLLQAMILEPVGDNDLWNRNFSLVLTNEEKLGEAFKPSIEILKAEQNVRLQEFENVVDDMRAIVDNPAHSLATKSWANLMLFVALRYCDDLSTKLDVLRQITPAPDAHMVVAVAQQILMNME